MPLHNFRTVRGSIQTVEWDSEALAGNLLGDPTTRTVAVHLPEEYDASDADYPLFVELAAFTGSGLKRLSWQAFGESVPQRIERLVAEGRMGPVITVFPDAFTTLGGNQYVDGPVLGRWESYLVAELVPRIEDRFRVRSAARHRAVYGKSSGGYGALVQGMRHGDAWGAVACHSGDIGFDWLYRPDLPAVLDVLARHGGDIEQFIADLRSARKIKGHQLHTLMILAMAASYDPDPAAPLGIRLPVDSHTCELDLGRWQRWLEHDPLMMVENETCRESLGRLNRLYLDCGSRDPYRLHYGARALARRFQAHGVSHLFEEFDDDHSGLDYRLDRSLPLLYDAIVGV